MTAQWFEKERQIDKPWLNKDDISKKKKLRTAANHLNSNYSTSYKVTVNKSGR